MIKKSASAAVFLLVALALGACNTTSSLPPDSAVSGVPAAVPAASEVEASSVIGKGQVTVQGYVASQNGGAAVAGSTITLSDDDGKVLGSGKTDVKGQFSFNAVPGSYTLDFAKKGYAGSRVEGFPVTVGMTTPLYVIQKVAFDSSFPTTPPKLGVTALSGTTETPFPNDAARALSFNASTGLTLRYVATSPAPSAGTTSLSPSTMYADIGLENTPGSGFFGSRSITSNDPKNTVFDQTVKVTGDALRGVRGASYLNLVAYDFNYNRVNKYLPVVINDDKPINTPVGAFLNTRVQAVTIAQKYNGGGFNGVVQPLGIQPQAAPVEKSTLWVDLNFEYQAGLTGALLGYRVFTSDDDKTFRLLKTLPASARVIRDSSPTLTPGQKVYYYIQAFNSTQQSDSPVVNTTPLDSFTVTNMGPTNHSRGVSVTPTLSWTFDKKVGDYRKTFVLVNDYPSLGSYCFWGSALCGDVTEDANNVYMDDGSSKALSVDGLKYSVLFNENKKAVLPALEAFHSYTFDVAAAAYSKDGKAISIAQDYYNVFYPALGGCNFGGPVCEGQLSTFTTGDGSN